MTSKGNPLQFHYLYAVEFGNKRIQRPESMKFILGRSRCSDFVISSGKVAKKQCEIVCSGVNWLLHNLSPEGTSLVGRIVVRDDTVKLQPSDIVKIGGIYIQFKYEVEPAEFPLRVLKINVLIGEKYCHLAAESENENDPSCIPTIGTVKPEIMEESVMEIPDTNSNENAAVDTKAIIDNLTSENAYIMQELKEMKTALRKALMGQGEAEVKAAQMKEQLRLTQEKSAKGDVLGEMIETELQCSVCNELIIDAITLDCSHTFCEHCLGMWKKKNKICPLCRSNINHECKSRIIDNLIERIIENLPEDTQKRRKELSDTRKASKRPSRNQSRGRPNKRKRSAPVVYPGHEVVRISHSIDAVNETIDITSDDDIDGYM